MDPLAPLADAAGATAQAPPEAAPADVAPTGGSPDPTLDELRAILARPDRAQAEHLAERVAELEQRTGNRDELIAVLTPVLGDVIRRKIADSRDEMIEALYPIIGQLIGRAVAEAIRDLARVIDARMRTSFSLAAVGRRLRARLTGVPDAALTLRDALPFRVNELFLIHRESGLLLKHLTNEPDVTDDSDLVSGMLTAIRDFAQDAFGRGQEGQLDEIQYGTRRILIEASRHAYLAVVVDGIEPAGFRAALRERVITLEHSHTEALRSYDGNAARFAQVETMLGPLMSDRALETAAPPAETTRGQKRVIVGLAALLLLCMLAACGGGIVWLRNALARPTTTLMVVVTATPGPTATLTSTRSPTQTPTATPQPTATVTATATPTATIAPTATPIPVIRVGPQRVNVRLGPAPYYSITAVAEIGRVFAVIGRDETGQWWQVCCVRDGQPGWVAAAGVSVSGDTATLPVVAGP